MKLVMPGKHLKMLHRAIVYLSRIGISVYFEATPTSLILRTLRPSESSFTWVTFRDTFFDEMDVRDDVDETDEFNENNFRLSVKPCLKIFRNTKDVERCTMQIDAERSKLVVYMQCKSNIRKIRMINIQDEHEKLVCPDNNPEAGAVLNKFSVQSALFSKILTQFSTFNGDVTIDFDIANKQAKLRNFIEDPENDKESTRTEYKLSLLEFEKVQIHDSHVLSLYLKDLKSLVNFANQTRSLVNIRYFQPGRQILLSVSDDKENLYTTKLVMATLEADIIAESRRKENELLQSHANKRQRDSRLHSGAIQTESSGLNRPSVDVARNVELVSRQSIRKPNTSLVKEDTSLNASKKRKKVDPKLVAHYKKIRDLAFGRYPSTTMSSLHVSADDVSNLQDNDVEQQMREMSQVFQNEVEDPFPEMAQQPFKKPGFTYKPVPPKSTECREKENRASIFEGIHLDLPSTSKSLQKPTAIESEEMFSTSAHDLHLTIEDSVASSEDVLHRKLYQMFRPCFEPTQSTQEQLMLAGDVLAYNTDSE